MALSTASRRYSMIQFGALTGRVMQPVPDATIGTADRAHRLHLYAGISLDVPVVDAVIAAASSITGQRGVRTIVGQRPVNTITGQRPTATIKGVV